jgi:hypothetical protein
VSLGIDNAKVSVFATRVELSFNESQSTNEATFVEVESLRAVRTVPNINQTVGTASIGNALVIKGAASKAGLLIASKNASPAVKRLRRPKSNVLGTDGYKTIVA